jgi:2-iminobutanoate/2-iminopropanoate deaminase
MDKAIPSSNRAVKPSGIFSQGLKVRNLIFISGQIAKNPNGEVVGKGDIRAQTRQCIENLNAVLEAGGATLGNLVNVTVYVTHIEYLKTVHEVRAEYFEEKYPASTLVEVSRLTNQNCMIEMEPLPSCNQEGRPI